MNPNISVQNFNSISIEDLFEIFEITNKQYGDFNWIYRPRISDYILFIKENDNIVGFTLYSLVDNDNIDKYNYREYNDNIKDDALIINHIIVREEYQSKGVGKKIINYLSREYEQTILCKAWIPEDESKNKFFEKQGFSSLGSNDKPWSHIKLKCLGCGSTTGCICSGVVYAKNT